MENLKSDDKGIDSSEERKTIDTSRFADRLSAAGWGLLFIWIGIALLLKLGASINMLGIGTIMLLVQVISKYLNMRIRLFYVVIGLLFMAGGFWQNYKPDFPLIPVFLIVVGTGLLLTFIKHIISK
jgi:hypothetical protein